MVVTNKYQIFLPAPSTIFVYEYNNCLYSAVFISNKLQFKTGLYTSEGEATSEIKTFYNSLLKNRKIYAIS